MNDHKNALIQLLCLRKEKRFRLGAIQLAVLVEIISDGEWRSLKAQICRGKDKPTVKPSDGS